MKISPSEVWYRAVWYKCTLFIIQIDNRDSSKFENLVHIYQNEEHLSPDDNIVDLPRINNLKFCPIISKTWRFNQTLITQNWSVLFSLTAFFQTFIPENISRFRSQ